MSLADLTPIETHNGILYKRDDYYLPFGEDGISGGKVRQAMVLMNNNLDHIIENCNSTVITPTSVHSPQGAIIARVAQHYGLKCICCIGGAKPETVDKHPMMLLAKYYNAEVRIVCGHGMNNVIQARINTIVEKEKFYPVAFGINAESNPDAIFGCISNQVENIPDELETLVIPVGSGIQMASILIGLKKFKKKVNRIVGVCVGPSRRKVIDKYIDNSPLFPFPYEYEQILAKDAYSKMVIEFVGNEVMDEIYEAKAHAWMLKNVDLSKKTLFWIIGRRITDENVNKLMQV